MSDAFDTFNSFPRGRPVGMKGRKVIFQAGTNMLGIDPLTPLEKRGMKSRAAYLSRRDSKMPPLRMESSRLDGGPMRIPFAAPAAKPKASLKTALQTPGRWVQRRTRIPSSRPARAHLAEGSQVRRFASFNRRNGVLERAWVDAAQHASQNAFHNRADRGPGTGTSARRSSR